MTEHFSTAEARRRLRRCSPAARQVFRILRDRNAPMMLREVVDALPDETTLANFAGYLDELYEAGLLRDPEDGTAAEVWRGRL